MKADHANLMRWLFTRMLPLLALLCFGLWLTSCSTIPPVVPEEKPAPAPVEYPVSGWGPVRHAMALEAIEKYGKQLFDGTGINPQDAKEWGLCKTDEGRKQFYAHLLSALSKFESNWKSRLTYTEGFKDAKGKPVVSAGLLQLSVESGRGYGCPVSKTEDFFDDKTSIECAVRIASRWIGRNGAIQAGKPGEWYGMAKYWSPFRKPERIASMKEAVKAVCQ